jgi:hypothetical protein
MTCKEFVKKIYPNAFLLIDPRDGWYSEMKYTILSKPVDVLDFIEYTEIMIGEWSATERTAWKRAKDNINEELLNKLSN